MDTRNSGEDQYKQIEQDFWNLYMNACETPDDEKLKRSRFHKVMDSLYKKVYSEDENISLKAAIYIADRQLGKPKQAIDTTSNGETVQTAGIFVNSLK